MIRIMVFQMDLLPRRLKNISKEDDGKKVMIFSDSRTNPSEEGEDDKNCTRSIQSSLDQVRLWSDSI